MQVGDIRTELPTMDSEAMMDGRGPQKCVVTYIHPEYRFYVVEFTSTRGERFRETFYFQDKAPWGPPLPERFRRRIATPEPKDRGRFVKPSSAAIWRPLYS